MLNLITMIEYVNSYLLLTLPETIYHIYYKYKIFFRVINIVILNQLNNLEKDFDFEVIKTKRGRKKKTDIKMLPKINEKEKNDLRDKRDRLVACVLSVNSKQYLGLNTLNSKLMKWTSIASIYCQINTNPF